MAGTNTRMTVNHAPHVDAYYPLPISQSTFPNCTASGHSSIVKEQMNTKVKTSVLCPGWVRTRILDASRNRPNQIQDKSSNEQVTGNHFLQEALESGVSPEIVAEHVFHAR